MAENWALFWVVSNCNEENTRELGRSLSDVPKDAIPPFLIQTSPHPVTTTRKLLLLPQVHGAPGFRLSSRSSRKVLAVSVTLKSLGRVKHFNHQVYEERLFFDGEFDVYHDSRPMPKTRSTSYLLSSTQPLGSITNSFPRDTAVLYQ